MTDTLIMTVLGIVGFILNILVLAIGGTYKLSSVEASIREAVAQHRSEIDVEFIKVRERITEIELYIRDHYVERGTFAQVVQSIMSDVKTLGERIETRMLRIEAKVDQVITTQHSGG